LSDRTALIVAVHLYGLPCDVDTLAAFGLPVLEDAAQAHLASYRERRAGALGVAGCFSFYASKNMTTAEGGAVTTDEASLADRVKVMRNQGMRDHYDVTAIGWNLRMSEIAAAIGRVQLRRVPEWTRARRRVASMMLEALEGIDDVRLPTVPAEREPAWHRFTIRLGPFVDRDAVIDKLAADGIQARVHYPWIVPDLEPYSGHPRIDAGLPLDRARAAATSVLSLPSHPGIREGDAARIASSLRTAVSSARKGSR
ncbi:MAG: DegT/DnrJ/EryC1/StrS family aminotransferase, partial [Actinomycetota bacterium]